MAEKDVTVRILGDASDFRKTVKKTQDMQKGLGKLTGKYRKSGLKHHKDLQKVTKKFNKDQKAVGKEALKHEKKLQKAMQSTISLMKKKQKAGMGTADALEKEVKQLKKLEKEYRKVHKFRKGTGVRTGGERAGRAGSALRGGLKGGAVALGAGIMALVGGAVNAVVGQISQGYSSYINFGRAQGRLAGTGAPMDPFARGRNNKLQLTGFEHSRSLGFTATETLGHRSAAARATGSWRNAPVAQAFARGYGGDVNEVMGLMGQITKGTGDFGPEGRRQLETIMQHSFTAGMDKSRAGEAMASVGQAVQIAGAGQVGKVDSKSISALLTYFSRSGQPGLQGARGVQAIGAIDQTLRSHGRIQVDKQASKALAMQSLGYGVVGGDTSDYFEVMSRFQQGVFGKGGIQNLLDYAKGAGRAAGGMRTTEAAYMLSGDTGLTMLQSRGILGRIAEGGPNLREDLEEMLEEAKPVDQQIADSSAGTHETVKRIAELDNRQVEIGREARDSIEQIQDQINKLVDVLLPAAIAALEMIAGLMTYMSDMISTIPGVGESMKTADVSAQKRIAGMQSALVTGRHSRKKMIGVHRQATSMLEDLPMPSDMDDWSPQAAKNRMSNIMTLRQSRGAARGWAEASRRGLGQEQGAKLARLYRMQERLGTLRDIRSRNVEVRKAWGGGSLGTGDLDWHMEQGQAVFTASTALSRSVDAVQQRINSLESELNRNGGDTTDVAVSRAANQPSTFSIGSPNLYIE